MTGNLNAKTWWLRLWGAIAGGLIVVAFFLPFRYWVAAFFVGFGTMESIGIFWSHGGKYPPLTDVVRVYVPRWATLAVMMGLLTAAAAAWGASWSRPWTVALWAGTAWWLTNHFTERYEEAASD